MSDARSLTPLSENDYDAIAAAVMETARGRWFMAEYAKRNRQADTNQLLSAISRLERVVSIAEPQPTPLPDLSEAVALIMDLRSDLERLSGKAHDPSTGLSARIETAAESIIFATEGIQEVAWGLRENGADETLCDRLDRRATEIYAATVIVEGTGQQIAKIADTIAMLDSNLRAFAEGAHHALEVDLESLRPEPMMTAPPCDVTAKTSHEIDTIEVVDQPRSVLGTEKLDPVKITDRRRLGSLQAHEDDVAFIWSDEEPIAELAPLSAPKLSESDLRKIDEMPVREKLAYFA